MENRQFSQLGISEEIQRAVSEMGFEEATAIQALSIPLILGGRDIIGQSQTGTGKTAAFGIPAIESIDIKRPFTTQVLILCPTRELAVQACDEIRKFAKYKPGIKTVPIYGGQPIDRQIKLLRAGAPIVVGTPGRIMDLMRRKVLKLQNIKMIVLDEADEMLNMGFIEDIETILMDVPEERQTILFSATMPPAIIGITKRFQTNPEMLKLSHQQLTVPTTDQYYFEVPRGKKIDVLCNALDMYNPHRSIVFCNTKKQVDELQSEMQTRGYMAAGLHGDMKQTARTQVLNAFKAGKLEVLLATDVAARGIDVEDVEAVFNFDIPQDEEYYVHRIGRTGRAGKSGQAFTFVAGRAQLQALQEIQRFTGKKIVCKPLPTNADINESRQNKMVQEIKNSLEGGDLSQYAPIVSLLMDEDYNSLDIAAALIKIVFKDKVPAPQAEVVEDSYAEEGMARLRVNVGRYHNISVNHILGAVAGQSGLPGKAIGKIDLGEKYSFFEVPKSEAQAVIKSMTGCKIRGIPTKTVLMESEA